MSFAVEGQPTLFLLTLLVIFFQDVKMGENSKFKSYSLASKHRFLIPFFFWNHNDVVSTFTDGCTGREKKKFRGTELH